MFENLSDAAIREAFLQGIISGVVVVFGVVLGEWLIRSRDKSQRRDAVLTELNAVLPNLRDLVREGGILAGAPGSAQGQEARFEAVRIFGLLSELLATTGRWPWGRRSRFRKSVVRLAAVAYVGIRHAPLNSQELTLLHIDELRQHAHGKTKEKGLSDEIERILSDRNTP